MRSTNIAVGGAFLLGLVATAGSANGQVQFSTQSGYQQQPVQSGYQQQPVQSGYQQQPVQSGYQQQPVQSGYQQQPVQSGYQQQPTGASVPSNYRKRAAWEMGSLYVTSTAYGFGLGVWASTEIGIEDPGTFLIPPIVLGVAAPIGAFALDRPKMKRGKPLAITAGLMLGAGEGLGIWGTQRVNVNAENAWGFRGLSRACAIGSTVGGVGGYFAGEFLQPPPTTSILAISGAFWGTAVGSMIGYGASSGDWGEANDQTSIGGLIGYNAGMLAAGGLGAAMVPSEKQLAWMWTGAGIGAGASLPVFLLYAGEGGPPARRGFVFMGTATTLGIVAGGVFGASRSKSTGMLDETEEPQSRSFAQVQAIIPTITSDQVGLGIFGTLE